MKRIELVLAGVTLAMPLLIGSGSARAQDPVVVNSSTVHVKLENRHVRVLEATLQPGQKEQMHSHPATILYVISGGKVRNHTADGKTTEGVLHAGDVSYREPTTHWAENVGTTTIHLILVELKDPP
ncbi:MAG: cupin domain-containing protein [Acidobacteriota bacterium]